MLQRTIILSLAAAVPVWVAHAQRDWSSIDPDLIVENAKGLNLTGCWEDMVNADIDGSGAIERREYLNFINVYGRRICYYQEELSLDQIGAFNYLSCLCEAQGNDASCCLFTNAKLPTSGAMNNDRTEEELLFLTNVCVVTDALLERGCTPTVLERSTGPPFEIVPVGSSLARATDLQDGSIWAMIMGIIGLLLLVCLCCCCCAAGTKSRSREEEEHDENVKMIPGPVKESPPAEQAPRDMDVEAVYPLVPPPKQEEEEEEEEEEEQAEEEEEEEEQEEEEEEEIPGGQEVQIEETVEEVEEEAAANRGFTEADDEDEGEGRRKRGSNYVDEDPEAGGPRWGAPRLPPPEDPEPDPLKLKPVPPKDPEDPPEWDQPGREIIEARNKAEMEGQVFDPYAPDGGVATDDRLPKDPLDWRKDWNRPKPPEADESDNRKHRIQTGLGEGEVWDKLNEGDDQSKSLVSGGVDVFDWVVQSALGVLDNADDQTITTDNAGTDYNATGNNIV